MEKVIRNGKVAVLFSPGFGAGWYTWNQEHKEIIFHPKIVDMVEKGKQGEIDREWMKNNIGIEGVYCGGASGLEISWIDEGDMFKIDEYYGSESIVMNYGSDFIQA